MRKVLAGVVIVVVSLFIIPVSMVLAQDVCEGNFDTDVDVDGTDAAVFKSDFGRSAFKNPCPPNGPAPVPKTGSTGCWDENGDERVCHPCVIGGGPCYPTGQDGMWQKGVALPEPRFTDNADGTITDNLTGVNWMENANCFDFNTWQEALDYCNDLSAGTCGLTDGSSAGDWRLPNRRELFSLIDDGFAWYSIPNTAGTEQWSEGDPFYNLSGPDGPAKTYWSSTTCMNILTQAWYVVMSSGAVNHEIKSSVYRVWCVREGQ